MTVSEYIFDFLQQKGIDTIYMVSGSSAMWLTDSLYKNEKLQAVCMHHEQAAAMAADLYGRMRGVPGAALVTIGPGAANAVTGAAQAYVDSSALFIISGQAGSRLLRYEQETGIRQHGTQSLNLEPMVSSITKYFAAVLDPADIRYHMERAYFEAVNGRRGPVWIDVTVDLATLMTIAGSTDYEGVFKCRGEICAGNSKSSRCIGNYADRIKYCAFGRCHF